MGLVKYNYEVKGLGITLPMAYAMVKNLNVLGDTATAEFYIQASRDNAINLKPLEIKRLRFKVDRNTNPYETAYIESKKLVEVERYNPQTNETEKMLVDGIFTGWGDDK